MRFETSQTTPSFLDRRLQLRMLSFVGLISVVMVTLAVINGRSRLGVEESRLEVTDVSDSPGHEVRREPRSLKGQEFIIPVAYQGDSSEADTASDDRQLFKSRSQEKQEQRGLFPRRSSAAKSRDGSVFEEGSALDDQLSIPTETTNVRESPDDFRPAIPLKDNQIPNSPESHNRNGISDALLRNRVDLEPEDFVPARKSLSFDESSSVDDLSREPFEDFVAPDRPNEPRRRSGHSTVPSTGTIDDDVVDDDVVVPKFGTRSKREDELNNVGSVGRMIDDIPDSDPLDRSRGKDLFMSDPPRDDLRDGDSYDAGQFQENIASVSIDKTHLELVQDNVVGIRRDEAEPYYWLLDHARRVSSAKFDRAGLRDVLYINLRNDPDHFRGEPITIEGDLWRLDEYDAGRNDYDVKRIYVGWVFTADSANHPYRVVCTSLGRGMAPGENLRKPIRVTGYFFKNEGYESNGGLRVAPTLLARSITLNSMPNGLPLLPGMLPYMLGTFVAIGLALIVTVVAVAMGDERSMQAGLNRIRRQPQLSFAGFGQLPMVSVEDSLRELAERERQAAISGAYGPLLSRQTAREHAVHEYAESQQRLVDEGQRRKQRQAGAVRDWAARQKERNSELEKMRATGMPHLPSVSNGEDLDSDKLAPARHPLVPTTTLSHELNHPTGSNELKLSAAIQIERDRLHREQQDREQIHRQQRESERLRTQQIAHEFAECERLDLEKRQSERDRERLAFDHDHRTTKLTHSTGTGEIEFEHERTERDRLEDERSLHDRFAYPTHGLSSHTNLPATINHEHERLEKTRLANEKFEREQHERERFQREFSVHQHDSTSNAHYAHSSTHEYDRAERERLERDRLEHERLEQDKRKQLEIEQEHARSHREYDRSDSLDDRLHSSHRDESTMTHSETTEYEQEDQSSKKRPSGRGWPQQHRDSEINDSIISDGKQSQESDGLGAIESTGETHKISSKRRGGWGWPKRRSNLENAEGIGDTNIPTSDEISEGTETEDPRTMGESTSGWGRSRKRRKNWRDSESA